MRRPVPTSTRNPAPPRRIALLLPSLELGGAEQVALNLARGLLRRSIAVDLVLAAAIGPLMDRVPGEARVVDLGARRVRGCVRPLARYLREVRPDAMISRMMHCNVAAVIARAVAGTRFPLVVAEDGNLSRQLVPDALPSWLAGVARRLYRRATGVAAVSSGVAADVRRCLRLPERLVHTIYNPIVDDDLHRQAAQPADHRWLAHAERPRSPSAGETPIVLTVGRLTEAKQLDMLLRAFARLLVHRPAKLIILGEGPQRRQLEQLAADLGVAGSVSLPGFASNPYAFMSRASVVALSSRCEGFGNVLAEALACGCPVVATDCDGPNEILDRGRYGRLVPVGDAAAMSEALAATLDDPPPADALRRRGDEFSVEKGVARYLDVLRGGDRDGDGGDDGGDVRHHSAPTAHCEQRGLPAAPRRQPSREEPAWGRG